MMYYEDDDRDYYICEKCARKNYPEVGINFCPCEGFPSKKKLINTTSKAFKPEIVIIDSFSKSFDFLELTFKKDKIMNLNKLRRNMLNPKKRALIKELMLSDGDILIIDAVSKGHHTSSLLSKHLKISVQSASARLSRLADKGYLTKKTVLHSTGGLINEYSAFHVCVKNKV